MTENQVTYHQIVANHFSFPDYFSDGTMRELWKVTFQVAY